MALIFCEQWFYVVLFVVNTLVVENLLGISSCRDLVEIALCKSTNFHKLQIVAIFVVCSACTKIRLCEIAVLPMAALVLKFVAKYDQLAF